MSRALELTVYERNEDGRYEDLEGFTYSDTDVEEFADWKRFKDAELAAEVWCQYAGLYYFKKNDRANLRGKRERQATINRFAELPHYDEVV